MFSITLQPQEVTELEVSVRCEVSAPQSDVRFTDIVDRAREALVSRASRECRVVSSNESLNRWFSRSSADLHMMLTETPYGLYPYAGIPWFSTPFGRDGIVTALETLWASPDIARGVLEFLAATQATTQAEAQDAEPGKILHEMRSGEMAALGEIPFGKYYGSADATPLFVVLAAAYVERTGDRELIDRCGRIFLRPCSGWSDTAIATVMGSSNTRGAARPGWSSRVGKTPSIPCSMPTARSRRRRSPSARFRAMPIRRGAAPPASRGFAGTWN